MKQLIEANGFQNQQPILETANIMRTKRNKNLIQTLSLAIGLCGTVLSTHAQDIPAAINYQGRLTDNLGNTLASGYYEIEFRVWDDPTSTVAASLVWGRTFPLHVVDGGLFNILLSNDGGEVTSPGQPQFNDIRQAFGGEDRYLGLTITVDPSGTITAPSEISPRQQLASAPYAMQAQTANSVRNLGVTSAALANSAVTTDKLASGAVTTAQIGSNAVTTSQIANSAVTSAKLNINGDVHLNNHTLLLSTDTTSGLKHAGTFAGETYDGPALFGSKSGVLGTTDGGEKASLAWHSSGSVSLFGAPIILQVPGNGSTRTYVANTDGLFMLYAYGNDYAVQIYQGGGTGLFTGTDKINSSAPSETEGWAQVFSQHPRVFMWPLRSGDKIAYYKQVNTTANNDPVIQFIPFGLNATTASAQ